MGASLAWSAQEEAEQKAEEVPNFPYQEVVTKEGLVFRVPQDMPIEKRGGILAPIPFDEYTYGKLKQIDHAIATLEARLTKLEEELSSLKKEKGAPLKS